MLRPRGGKSPKHSLPRLLNRHQQNALALRVIAAFLLIAVVLVAAFIPHGGLGLMGGRRDAEAGAVLEKRMAPAAPAAGPKGPAAAAPVVGGPAKPGVAKAKGTGRAAAGAAAGGGAVAASAGPDAGHHEAEHPAVELLFDGAVLQDKEGNPVKDPVKALEGRAVGLLFGAMWCPMCQNFFPRIQEWLREAGRHEDIAIVYVSSDHDKGAAGTAQFEHGWDLAVPYENKKLRSELKEKFKVWAMVENGEFGKERKSGIPTIVAVDKSGHVLAHMDVGVEDMEVLDKHWRYKEWAW